MAAIQASDATGQPQRPRAQTDQSLIDFIEGPSTTVKPKETPSEADGASCSEMSAGSIHKQNEVLDTGVKILYI